MGWIGLGWDGLDLCVGLLYEHRFAMLITGEEVEDPTGEDVGGLLSPLAPRLAPTGKDNFSVKRINTTVISMDP